MSLQSYKGAVILERKVGGTRALSRYLSENWVKLTYNLIDATILLLSGRHGSENGRIGPIDERLIDWHQRLVMSNKLIPNSKAL